jgi:hypothetical protein
VSLPPWKLERFALGELPAAELAAIEARVAADPALRAALDALRADDAEIRAAHPAARVVPRLRARAPRPRRALAAGGAALALAAGALLWVQPPPAPDPGGDAGEERAKGNGAPQLQVLRAGDPAPLGAGAVARPGDLLGFRVNPGAGEYGVLLSVDGRGAVTRHFPRDGAPAEGLPPGATALDIGYELDDAPAFERFVWVTADQPLDPAALAEALAGLPRPETDPLPLPPGARAAELLVRKP